ncbi:MAG: nucleoside deaminase [Deltaproteobacteria bacterium]|jgi:tRNA(adenine34) deaminase|nr:nucleoside deaminase [Deltaproteobacteria bacterium]
MIVTKPYMQLALEQARLAAELNEVPVGAVVVCQDEVIATAHNEVEALNDATAHAELLALRRASKKLGRWRLNDCELFVTLEPCTMCIGALILARISKLYFGAYDERAGAVGSLYNIAEILGEVYGLKVYPEILADECASLLQEFFKSRR